MHWAVILRSSALTTCPRHDRVRTFGKSSRSICSTDTETICLNHVYSSQDKPRSLRHYTPSSAAADVAALLDHLELKKVTVVGHDWGAYAAWRFGIEHRERLDALIASVFSELLLTSVTLHLRSQSGHPKHIGRVQPAVFNVLLGRSAGSVVSRHVRVLGVLLLSRSRDRDPSKRETSTNLILGINATSCH